MKTVEATLLADYGEIDRNLARKGLLAERGITGVFDGPGDHTLTVEYDPFTISGEQLLETLYRHGLSSEVIAPPTDLQGQERWLEQLEDGRRVLIRPVRPEDVQRNAAFIEQLSPPSKHFLFLGGIAQLSPNELRRLCDPDFSLDMAYIALGLDDMGETGEQVGICRYAGADPVRGAEISVAVADAWQGQGLGRILLQRLIDYARAHGLPRLYSIDSVGNTRMRKLAHELGLVETPDPNDRRQVIYSIDLREPMRR